MDRAHQETEKALKRLESDIRDIYTHAEKECRQKLSAHLQRYAEKDAVKRKEVEDGLISKEAYNKWRIGQIAIGERWEEMSTTLATDLANADKLAESMTNGYRADVYALNHNYATFEVEKSSLVDTSYTLYDRQTVERLIAKNPKILPPPRGKTAQKLREGKLIRWNKQKLTGELVQGILQGESIDKIAKRFRNVANMDCNASIRNARTSVTSAQNAGRQDSYERAEDMGIKGKKMWIATMDARTRHWHVELDGETVDIGDKFHNQYGDIEYPADPDADPANVYNCRCTMVYVNEGFEDSKREWLEDRQNPALGDISYEQWKEEHAEAQRKKGYRKSEN